jgi:hypothetical protein
MKVILTESQYKNLVENFEHYDPEKLYHRQKIVNALKTAPKYIKDYIKHLPKIEVINEKGERLIATKIPGTIFQYLFGNF